MVRRESGGSNSGALMRVGNTQQSAVVEATTTIAGSVAVRPRTATNQTTRQTRTRAISLAAGHAIRGSTITNTATTHTNSASSNSIG